MMTGRGARGDAHMIVTGVVAHGKALGRRLGFPTANLAPDGPVMSENGVYAAAFWLEGEPLPRRCMVNQGVHPTAPEGLPTIEAHLLDFSGDLYGRRARIEYLRFLRPEHRFDGLDALKAQLRRDLEATRAYLDGLGRAWMA